MSADRDREIAELLGRLDVPDHGPGFWEALDARLEAATPEPGTDGADDEPVLDEPAPGASVFELGTRRAVSVFDSDTDADTDDGAVARRPRPIPVLDDEATEPHPLAHPGVVRRSDPRRWWGLVAAAAVLVGLVVAAAVVFRAAQGGDGNDDGTVEPAPGASSVPTTLPDAIGPSSVVRAQTPLAEVTSVPLGASPDGRFVYFAVGDATATACGGPARALVAQPAAGGAAFPVLADRRFAAPALVAGVGGRLAVVDGCAGVTLVRPSAANGVLVVERTLALADRRLDRLAFGAGDTVYVRDRVADTWLTYDLATDKAAPVAGVGRNVTQLAALASGKLLTATTAADGTVTFALDGTAVAPPQRYDDPTRAATSLVVSLDRRNFAIALAGGVVAGFAGSTPETLGVDAAALAWSADSKGLFVAPRAGGLSLVTFELLSRKLSTATFGFTGTALALVPLPGTSAVVVTTGDTSSGRLVPGDAVVVQFG